MKIERVGAHEKRSTIRDGVCLFILLAVGIGLYYSQFEVPSNKIISNAEQSEVNQSFKEAFEADKERVEKKKEVESNNSWKPSPTFVLVAISIGAEQSPIS
ncbi:hypothetical protein [Bacillus timonensis]|uniref:hypothetical protein n=1 Tax=Bacillus timonensis TaxID=1033734 RepID=UPI00028A1506|nr:hypothetical protein [Bacillus timonensis]